jgi:hypothetical protein
MPSDGKISARTLAEIEAGRRRVFIHTRAEGFSQLKAAGLDVSVITDPVLFAFHTEVAKQSGAIPAKKTRHCAVCGQEHLHGERCPVARQRVINWSIPS